MHARAHPPPMAGDLAKHGSESDKVVRASMAPWKHRVANIDYCHGHGWVCVWVKFL